MVRTLSRKTRGAQATVIAQVLAGAQQYCRKRSERGKQAHKPCLISGCSSCSGCPGRRPPQSAPEQILEHGLGPLPAPPPPKRNRQQAQRLEPKRLRFCLLLVCLLRRLEWKLQAGCFCCCCLGIKSDASRIRKVSTVVALPVWRRFRKLLCLLVAHGTLRASTKVCSKWDHWRRSCARSCQSRPAVCTR